MDAEQIQFAADRMLGRLARLLRLLGYDTLYAPATSVAELVHHAAAGRVVLTRGAAEKRFPGVANVYSVRGELAAEQAREVAARFSLDTRRGLWTRCTLCNGAIETMAKVQAEAHVPPKLFTAYQDFFRCAACGHVYWRGSHVERILHNLTALDL